MSEADILGKFEGYAADVAGNLGLLARIAEQSGWDRDSFIDSIVRCIKVGEREARLGNKKGARRVLAFVEGVLWTHAIIDLPEKF